jgi:hypothetical protein
VAPTSLIPVLQVRWGSCKGIDHEIFAYLFTSARIHVNTTETENRSVSTNGHGSLLRPLQNQAKTILVRNDVLGYYAGQNYKNAEKRIPAAYTRDEPASPWFQKMDTDTKFFRHLLEHFTGREIVEDFQHKVGWHNHTVIGLHIRAGNGEQEHFTKAARSITNTTAYVQTVVQLIQRFVETELQTPSSTCKPPLLFLATDQPDLIPLVQDLTRTFGVDTIVFPHRKLLNAGEGVSYQTLTKGVPCLSGWVASTVDMALLAGSDTLVAGMRSTFTQILPLSMVFSRENESQRTTWKFCEASGQALTCFADRQAWVFRQEHAAEEGRIRTFRLDATSSSPSDRQTVHKLMVHFPDLEREPASQQLEDFLVDPSTINSALPYGERMNTKYRFGPNGEKVVFRENWVFAL